MFLSVCVALECLSLSRCFLRLISLYTYIYMCIYIYLSAVKLLTGPRLAILIVTNWATLIVTNWATSFSHYKNRGFRWFLGAQLSFCVFFCFQLFFSYPRIAIQKRGAKIVFFFSIFSVLSYFFWKFSFFGLLKHYKNRGFSNFGGFLLLKEKK